jgi:hypothetical protein
MQVLGYYPGLLLCIYIHILFNIYHIKYRSPINTAFANAKNNTLNFWYKILNIVGYKS